MKYLTFSLWITCGTFWATALSGQYLSSTAIQVGNPVVYAGTNDNLILRIELEIGTDPVTLKNVQFSTDGCTSPNPDISKFRLYYYNDSNAFNISLASLIGTFTNPWSTAFTFLTIPTSNYSGITLFSGMTPGKNYFWLTYDLTAGAKYCDTIDVAYINCVADAINYTPTQQIPPGCSIIDPCLTGISEHSKPSEITIAPIPAGDLITLNLNRQVNKPIVIELSDFTGKIKSILFEGLPYPGTSELQLNLQDIPPGMYLIRTSGDQFETFSKIIKN